MTVTEVPRRLAAPAAAPTAPARTAQRSSQASVPASAGPRPSAAPATPVPPRGPSAPRPPRISPDRDRATARAIADHTATARKTEARRAEVRGTEARGREAPHAEARRTGARTSAEPVPASAPQPGSGRARARSSRTAPALPLTFESYVRARGSVLLRTARSLTPNPYDAEDLLQTALAKTYSAWERIEDHGAVDGYVRRALVNTRTSQWRKRRVDEYSCAELPEPEPTPVSDPAEAQAVRDAMWHAVRRLPARQRAMVTLRYYEDLSEAQTAEVLGVSVGTVKSAVSRALAKLREDRELVLIR